MIAATPAVNKVSSGFDLEDFEPSGFWSGYGVLHRMLAPRQRALTARRREMLLRAQLGDGPDFLPPSGATSSWAAAIPGWSSDQRISLIVPADDVAEIERGRASGVQSLILDLEDLVVDDWTRVATGIENIRRTLAAPSSRGRMTAVKVRDITRSQAGILPGGPTSAALFDLASIFFALDLDALEHPLLIYIPKSELAEESAWWRDAFVALAEMRNLPRDFIKCVVMFESYPIAYQLEEFVYGLRSHAVGIAFGRHDYLASMLRYHIADPAWVLSDYVALPHDVPLVVRARDHMVDVAHRHAMLAIGEVAHLLPQDDPRAAEALALEKGADADALTDGTLILDASQFQPSAVHFESSNRFFARKPGALRYPTLLEFAGAVGRRTYQGTRDAIRSILAMQAAASRGLTLSRDGARVETPATERLHRVMVAQRVRHRDGVEIVDDAGRPVYHAPALISRLLDTSLPNSARGGTVSPTHIGLLSPWDVGDDALG